jgi:hypothetical protein
LCTLYYGRGIAYAVLGDVTKAREQQALFRNQIQSVPPDRVRHNNLCSDLNRIAEAMLEGEILYREGKSKVVEVKRLIVLQKTTKMLFIL